MRNDKKFDRVHVRNGIHRRQREILDDALEQR